MSAVTAQRFTAWAMCPQCLRVECHGVRAPQPDFESRAMYRCAYLQMKGELPNEADIPVEGPELAFEVIRTCRCGQEWGQEPIA